MTAYASLASGNESVNAGNKGLAYNNQDFVFSPMAVSLCLAPGQTEGSIPLTVLGDTTREADELLVIGLQPGPGGPVEFADNSALVTLLNDDGSTVSACIQGRT